MNYYNDNDPKAAAWLRELIKQNLIPPGDVDERSIEDVRPADLVGYTQCHFFAGIGGWPYALRLAGWPDDWPVWTGSCPCQPYSSAGSRKGDDDPRALWWAWRWLIDQCRPPVIFGEQVASADGRRWLSGVRADLESMGYAFGAADLPAASVGAPHIRQRLFWVADAEGGRYIKRIMGNKTSKKRPSFGGGTEERCWRNDLANGSATSDGRVADCAGTGQLRAYQLAVHRENGSGGGAGTNDVIQGSENGGVANSNSRRVDIGQKAERGAESSGVGADGGLGDADGQGLSERESVRRLQPEAGGSPPGEAAGIPSPWSDAVWIPCADGKARRIKPGLEPLVDGLPGRVALLRGAGNAIVPQVAAEFIKAYEECDR